MADVPIKLVREITYIYSSREVMEDDIKQWKDDIKQWKIEGDSQLIVGGGKFAKSKNRKSIVSKIVSISEVHD